MSDWMGAASFAAVLVTPEIGADEAMMAVALTGGRVTARIGWDELHGLSPLLADRPVILAEVPGDIGQGALESLAAILDEYRLDAVVVFEEDALDPVAAALMAPRIVLLCDPDPAERVAALAIAAHGERVAIVGVRESDADRLRRLNEEVARIAALLAGLSSEPPADTVGDRRRTFESGPSTVPPPDPQAIRRAIRARRLRDGFFPPALFEDPAWDMLLDLAAAELEGEQVSVSSLCIAAAVAPTTALRWITRMTDLGLLGRAPDPQDRRRAFVTLTPAARDGMRNYLAAVERAGLPIA